MSKHRSTEAVLNSEPPGAAKQRFAALPERRRIELIQGFASIVGRLIIGRSVTSERFCI